nr:ABC transporter permease [Carnobacterium maltaromaticum]
MFGIIIGISSVITILALGRGFEKDTIKNLTKSESKNVEVQINFNPDDINLYGTNTSFFQETDISAIKEIEGIKHAEYTKTEENQIYKDIYTKDNKKKTNKLNLFLPRVKKLRKVDH